MSERHKAGPRARFNFGKFVFKIKNVIICVILRTFLKLNLITRVITKIFHCSFFRNVWKLFSFVLQMPMLIELCCTKLQKILNQLMDIFFMILSFLLPKFGINVKNV